jgi:hypothetical protein
MSLARTELIKQYFNEAAIFVVNRILIPTVTFADRFFIRPLAFLFKFIVLTPFNFLWRNISDLLFGKVMKGVEFSSTDAGASSVAADSGDSTSSQQGVAPPVSPALAKVSTPQGTPPDPKAPVPGHHRDESAEEYALRVGATPVARPGILDEDFDGIVAGAGGDEANHLVGSQPPPSKTERRKSI